jgi:Zn-dependent alcohol dehydrogenase
MLTTAAVCTAFGAPLELREIEIDDPGPGEVRVRILASGVCGSDTKLLAGGNPMYADPASGAPPIVAGHECVGVVEAVGPGVAELAAGEHVVVSMNRW